MTHSLEHTEASDRKCWKEQRNEWFPRVGCGTVRRVPHQKDGNCQPGLRWAPAEWQPLRLWVVGGGMWRQKGM